MKTYAICKTPQELRDKLVNYYTLLAEKESGLVNITALKRDKASHEARATLLYRLSKELKEMDIREIPPEFSGSATLL